MFNADIAAETRDKLAKDEIKAWATTFHAAGWSAMLRAFPQVKLSGIGPKMAGYDKWALIVEQLEIPSLYQARGGAAVDPQCLSLVHLINRSMYKSLHLLAPPGEVITLVGDNVRGAGWYGSTTGLHTIAIRVLNFQGQVSVEASIATLPTASDWYSVLPGGGDL